MKKFLILLSFALFLSGCGNEQNPNLPLAATETIPIPTPTLKVTIPPDPTPTTKATDTPQPTIPPVDQPKIILYIGDGMGSEHRTAGQYYMVGEVRQLAMDSLPVHGWLGTAPLDDGMTESASAATALATGQKTNTGLISQDLAGNPITTILEHAQELGMATGLVSTKHITDATTAAFAAHVESNAKGTEVAEQFLVHGVNVIFGGGENYFLPQGMTGCHPDAGARADGRNLVEEANESGYTFVCDAQAFKALDAQTTSFVLGLFADESMERPFTPSLAEMTQTAIEILSQNPNGYFLVVEGAMIDTASHYHESINMMEDVAGLDEAISQGLTYAEKDDEILILVTADHETGGIFIELNPNDLDTQDGPFQMPSGAEFYITWTTADHTSVNVPVTALGPGAERLRGLHENTAVFDLMYEYLGSPGHP